MASIVAGDWAASTGARNPKLPETAISIVPRNASKTPTSARRPILVLENGGGGLSAGVERGRHDHQHATRDQGQPAPAQQRGQRRAFALENNSFFHGPTSISAIGLVTWSLLTVPDPYFVTSGGGPSSRSPHRGCRRRVLSASPQPCRTDLTLRPSRHTTNIARAPRPTRRIPDPGGAVNSALTSRAPRRRARPSPACSITPLLFQVKMGRAMGASRFIHSLVVRTSQV